MDPLIEFSKRNSDSFPYLTYDQRQFFETESSLPDIKIEIGSYFDQKLYANNELHELFITNLHQIVQFDKIVFDRGNPFMSMDRFLSFGDDIKYLAILFNFVGNHVVFTKQFNMEIDLITNALLESPMPNNVVIEVGDSMDLRTMEISFLLSHFYKKITILRPIFGPVRYLIGIDLIQSSSISNDKLREIKDSISMNLVKSYFNSIPTRFQQWFIYMNNMYMTMMTEFYIHILESQKAFKTKSFYWTGQSYDIRRAVSLVKGETFQHQITKPKLLRSEMKTEDRFFQDMHLYTNVKKTTDPIHAIINMEKDNNIPYRESTTRYVGGIHWGQRKLLLSEIDFFTQNLKAGEKAVAIYIGACPFDHGPALLDRFPDLNMLLFDPRDNWSKELRSNKYQERIKIVTGFLDEKEIETIVGRISAKMQLSNNEKKKYFFISDIRNMSNGDNGIVENQLNIHLDMQLQKNLAIKLYEGLSKIGIDLICSLKFHLPFVYEIGNEDYEYGKGTLHTQPWARPHSAELRLWWNPKDGMTTYNKRKLEDIMMYHNMINRDQNYGELPFDKYDGCHDCHYEVQILTNYVRKFGNRDINIEDELRINNVSESIDRLMNMTLKEHSNNVRVYSEKLKNFKMGQNPQVARYDARFEVDRFGDFNKRTKNTLDALSIEFVKGKQMIIDFMIGASYLKLNPTSEESVQLFSKHASQFLNKEVNLRLAKTALQAFVKDPKIQRGAYSENIVLSRQKKGTKFFTFVFDGKSTIAIHKDSIRNFLIKSEYEYKMSSKSLRSTPLFNRRIFAIMKRYESVWNDHFALLPMDLFRKNPSLKQMILGMNSLTIPIIDAQNDINFQALFPDLEIPYSNYTSILSQKVIKNDDEDEVYINDSFIMNHNVMFIFLPNIAFLQERMIDVISLLLNKYNDIADKAIVILAPSTFDEKIKSTLSDYLKESSAYDYNIFNVLKQSEEKLKSNHNIYTLRTKQSNFVLDF
tara:strand:+ start:22381 stop:25320 length:2940 start_codon:yes stop_codon:yes gene_type:complete